MKIRVRNIDKLEYKEIAYAIRRKVFIEEQKVDYSDEFDEFEKIAHHYLLTKDNTDIGTARWRITDQGIKLERFAILKSYRNQGLGEILLKKILEDIQNSGSFKGAIIYLHAQLKAVHFYERNGFSKEGKHFWECNICHYLMKKKIHP